MEHLCSRYYGYLKVQKKRGGVCLPDLAVLQSEDAVHKNQEANQSSRKQHPCIPAEPSEVQTDLLPKISPAKAAEDKKTDRLINLCISTIDKCEKCDEVFFCDD